MATPGGGEPELEWWDKVRAIGKEAGFEFGTITLNGTNVELVDETSKRVRTAPSPLAKQYTPHQQMVLDSFASKAEIYADRSAIYRDNYKVVGRVMEALFSDGAPRLYAATDYDRWHIFELIIVKLTRYTQAWPTPHKDSVDDMGVYAAILGAIDEEERRRQAEFETEEE